MVTSHQITLSGLAPGTTYYFQVSSTDSKNNHGKSGGHTFKTSGFAISGTISPATGGNAATVTLSGAASTTTTADGAGNYTFSGLSNGTYSVVPNHTGFTFTPANQSVNVNGVSVTGVNFTDSAAAATPTITTQPVSQTVTAGQTASFTVVATGTAPLNYQWQKNGVNIAGATATSYTTPATATTDSGSTFRVVVSNTAGTVTSGAATLTVNAAAVAPTITAQPVSQTVTAGQTASFTVAATGNAPLGYQWQKNGVNIAGATATSYTTPATATTDSGSTFRVVVSNAAGTVTSGAATLTVNSGTTAPGVPTGLSASAASSTQINLTWTASTGSVAGWDKFLYDLPGHGTHAFNQLYVYRGAFDAAGNTSAQSAGASATTSSAGGGGGGGGLPTTLGWYQIPSTQLAPLCPPYSEIQGASGCPAVTTAWGSAIPDTKRNRLIVIGGGHSDYFGNEVFAVDLNANPIKAVLVKDSTHGTDVTNAGSCPESYLDGSMASRHGFGGLQYLPNQDLYFIFGAGLPHCGSFSNYAWTFDPNALAWKQQPLAATHPSPAANGSVPLTGYDPVTGKLYYVEGNTGNFWSYDPGANAWSNLTNIGAVCSGTTTNGTIDVKRRMFICAANGDFASISLTAPYTVTSLKGTGCNNVYGPGGAAIDYDSANQDEVMWSGGKTVYVYNRDTDSCTAQTFPNGPPSMGVNGSFGKFRYFPGLGVFVVVTDINQNAYALRLTAAGGTGGATGPVISGVAVNSINTTGATTSWTTDVAATSQVEYGTTTAYGTLTPVNSTMSTSHVQALAGLSVGTLYHFRVHSINSSGVESISGDAAFSTNNTTDTTPPTVSISAPLSGATVAGTVAVTANATDNVGVTGVQFLLDGNNLGTQTSVTPPYSVSWNTTGVSNGAHTLSAKAFDAAGNVGNAISVTVTVSNSGTTPLADFQNRCAQPGVLVCEGFDDPAAFQGGTWPNSGLYPNGSNSLANSTQDTAVVASGAGSLKFTIPGDGGANAAGYWLQRFGQQFDQNTTFYAQYRQRFDPNFLANHYQTSTGATTYWKQQIFSNYLSTCDNAELTTINWQGGGFPGMYSQCGQDSLITSIGNGDYLLEQGATPTTGYNCHYQSANNTSNSCFMYPANTWVTFYYKVQIGTWGQPNSTIQAWVSVGGQPYQQWINITNHTLLSGTGPYDAVTLLPYMTGKDPAHNAGPTAFTWYDELIVSTQAIAAPNN